MAKYLTGDAAKLLSEGILEPTSSIRMTLLGREDEYTHRDWNPGEFRHFRYFKEGIEISGLVNYYGNPLMLLTLDFFMPAKER
jgi:hypothetical protein